jgi:DNA-binding response OmpR family regulator
MQVLVVDDSPQVRELLRRYLQPHDVHVEEAFDGVSAAECVRTVKFEAVFIDWVLRPWSAPEADGNGISVCRALRDIGETAPVWMYSAVARGGQALIAAVDAGADDFIESPLENLELFAARVRAMKRRHEWEHGGHAASPPLVVGIIEIDRVMREAKVGGHPAGLTRSEFDLLAYLVARSNTIVSHEELFRNVIRAPAMRSRESNALFMLVQRLRGKLGEASAQLESVRGLGYRLIPLAAAEAPRARKDMASRARTPRRYVGRGA